MLLLEEQHRVLEKTLQDVLNDPKPIPVLVTFADFDGVTYLIQSEDSKPKQLRISMQMSYFKTVMANGGSERLTELFGSLVAPKAESGYDLTLSVDGDNLPMEKDAFIHRVSRLKTHVVSSPLWKARADVLAKKGGNSQPTAIIKLRTNDYMYVKSLTDRVVVIFALHFQEVDDIALGRVFCQEFADCRRDGAMSRAPPASYSPDAPLELDGLELPKDVNTGYMSFALSEYHLAEDRAHNSIATIITFRDYLHYHLKCAKAYMHLRMRSRFRSMQQVLSRAIPEGSEKSSASKVGKTSTFGKRR